MVSLFIQGPARSDEGAGLNLENVAEEVLNGMFCHYEPPTSETAQLKAVQEAIKDPAKYSVRPMAKPILRPSRLHRQNKNKANNKAGDGDGGGGTGTSGGGNASSSKSVTWRDEQNHRSNVEKKIVNCASGYCGIFKAGEGLADVLMSPTNNNASCERSTTSSTNTTTSMMKGGGGGGTTTTASSDKSGTPTSMASSSQASTTADGSKKMVKPILLNKTNNRTNESPSTKVLYDDEGNSIQEGDVEEDADNEIINPSSDASVTPGTPSTNGIEGGTPAAAAGTAGNNNDPMTFFSSFATSVMNTAAAAGAAGAAAMISVGQQMAPASASTPTPTAAGPAASTVASPSSSTVPSQAVPTSGVAAEYMDDLGMYEPESYDRPNPSRNSLPYRRMRSPRARHPTPRHARPGQESEEGDKGGRSEHNSHDGRISSTRRSDVYSDLTEDAIFYRSPRPAPRAPSSQSAGGAASGNDEDVLLGERDGRYYHHQDGGQQRSSRTSKGGTEMELRREYDRLYIAQKAAPEYSDTTRERHRPGKGHVVDDDEEDLPSSEYAAWRYGQRSYRGSNEGRDKIDRIDDDEDNDENRIPRQNNEETRTKHSQRRQINETDGEEGTREPYSTRTSNDKKREQEVETKTKSKSTSKNRLEDSNQSKHGNTTSKSTSRKSAGRTSMDRMDDELERRSRRTSQKTEIRSGDESGARDPTPTKSTGQSELRDGMASEPLPPTPRRNTERKGGMDDDDIRKTYDRFGLTYNSMQASKDELQRTKAALLRQLSPRSMATDDEIREEVSSVGMASETIRPLYYSSNPFAQSTPRFTKVYDDEERENADVVRPRSGSDDRPSTLSGSSRSTISFLPSADKVQKKSQQKHTNKSAFDEPEISRSSSGSTRSKKLWRGWKKTLGKVKQIVKEIDEQRIPPPLLQKKGRA